MFPLRPPGNGATGSKRLGEVAAAMRPVFVDAAGVVLPGRALNANPALSEPAMNSANHFANVLTMTKWHPLAAQLSYCLFGVDALFYKRMW